MGLVTGPLLASVIPLMAPQGSGQRHQLTGPTAGASSGEPWPGCSSCIHSTLPHVLQELGGSTPRKQAPSQSTSSSWEVNLIHTSKESSHMPKIDSIYTKSQTGQANPRHWSQGDRGRGGRGHSRTREVLFPDPEIYACSPSKRGSLMTCAPLIK